MRNVLTISGREVRAYFATPVAYVLLAVFLGFAGYFFYALLIAFNQTLQVYSMMRNPEVLQRFNLNEMVIRPLLHNMSVLLIFTVPAITMRMFPEERRAGTYELLLTSPVRVTEIVLGKFLGGLVVLLSMIGVSAVFPVILMAYGNPEVPMMLSGYLGLVLMAIAFLALGTLISSFTESFVVAYQSTLGALLGLYTIGWLAETLQGRSGDLVRYLSVTDHFGDLTKGVIDTKNLVYFASLVVVPLFVSVRSVESVRWRDLSLGGNAPLFGLLGLVFIAFGLGGGMLVGVGNLYMVLNLAIGGALLLAYFVYVSVRIRAFLNQRSTRHWAATVVYSALFVLLVAGVNFVGARRHQRWDVTEAGVYTLAAQSKKVVESLQQPLQMTTFVEGGANPQLESLLDSYRYVSAKVETRLVDPDREPALVEQMKITTVPSVHLRHGDENFVVTQPSEETVTNGVIRVTRSTKKVVYFSEGFGEADLQSSQDPKGYSNVKVALDQENYEVKTLLLPSTESIPEDASVVVVAGPTRPLTEPAVKALDGFLKRGGHLLVLVPSHTVDERLAGFLTDWGVKLGNDIVLDREVRLFEGPRLGVVPLSRTYGSHPITQGFKDYTAFPQTRTVEPETSGKRGLTATALVKTSATSWAETNVDDVFTKGIANLDDADRKGPVSVATAVTVNLKDAGIEGATGEARLVVFGTQMFADNQQLVQSRLNGDLFLNSVGWLVGQEELVAIRSRGVRASRAALTPDQAAQVFYLSMKIIPELLIAAGFIVWWRRRSA